MTQKNYNIITPLGPRSPRDKKREQATDALTLIDLCASNASLEYAFSVPFSREDVSEALAIGRCRTVRNVRLGNNSSANRRGLVGDLVVDMQGLLPELVLLPFLRHATGIERVAPLLEVAPSDGDDLIAGQRYDIKGVGMRRDGTVAATGCNINEKKRPDVFIVARIDYDDMLLHVYAVDGPSVFNEWTYNTRGFSPYYERQMPDAKQFNRRTAPVWLIQMIQGAIARQEREAAEVAAEAKA